jgi:hypothetical protein
MPDISPNIALIMAIFKRHFASLSTFYQKITQYRCSSIFALKLNLTEFRVIYTLQRGGVK